MVELLHGQKDTPERDRLREVLFNKAEIEIFDPIKEIELIEHKILAKAQISPISELGGILIRLAHRLRKAQEYYDEQLNLVYKTEVKNG